MNQQSENYQKLAGFLKEVESQIGVSLNLDEDGMCTIEFDRGLQVTVGVTEENAYFSLQAPLIEAPTDVSLPLLAEALRLNVRFADTRGGSIGLYDAEELLVFRYWQPLADCDGLLFSNILANFIATAYELHDRLMQIAQTMLRDFQNPSNSHDDQAIEYMQRV